MKVLVDIGHPAHVHLFRNMAFEMIKHGHIFLFTVREGDNQGRLLDHYGLDYLVIGRKQKGSLRKIAGLFLFSFRILRIARKFKPDLFLSHGSMYAGYAALLTGKKHIALEDTGNMEQIFFSKPVSDIIVSPDALQVDLGKKHFRYKGFHELAYLHPARFQPDKSILDELGVRENEPFVIMRFISWNATHDSGQKGLTSDQKILLVRELSAYARIFISGESSLSEELEKYAFKLEPYMLHHALYYSSLYIGEGATTASECAMLGTPALYINTNIAGTLKMQEAYGLVKCFTNAAGLAEEAVTILQTPGIKGIFRMKRDIMLSQNIDVTAFLIWLVENYPVSKAIMKNDPSFQDAFFNKHFINESII